MQSYSSGNHFCSLRRTARRVDSMEGGIISWKAAFFFIKLRLFTAPMYQCTNAPMLHQLEGLLLFQTAFVHCTNIDNMLLVRVVTFGSENPSNCMSSRFLPGNMHTLIACQVLVLFSGSKADCQTGHCNFIPNQCNLPKYYSVSLKLTE